ncbi:oligosaccharide flippase family protein [Rhodanobacter sp. Root179]|uniref:oligosaccharide flippase family protein n=1 Tax=Rhodanobacter sp. Root179 TaxID=1736482 RepID=UPI00138F4BB1|nr:oligosaccharide flippase family protein [Rhodanobacter sp. Root179]
MIRKLAGTAALTAISAVASRGVLFAGALIFARALGPVDYGTFSLLQMTALLFTTFFALGLGQMATKIVAEAKSGSVNAVAVSVTVSFGAGVACAALFMVVLIAFAHPLAVAVNKQPQDAPLYMMSALLVLTGTLIPIQNGIALGLGEVKRQAIANVVAAPLALLVIVFASWRGGVTNALIGYICAQAVVLGAQQMALSKSFKNLPSWWDPRIPTRKDWEVAWRFGAPTSVAGMLTVPSSWLALLFLARTTGNVQVGLFSFANQFRAISLFGIGTIANASLPQLTTFLTTRNYVGYRRLSTLLVTVMVAATSVLSLAVWVFGEDMFKVFIPKYILAEPALLILTISCIATAATSIYMRSATAAGDARTLIYGNAAFAVMLVPLAYFWTPKGATGLALATLAACVLQTLVFYILERRRVRGFK